VTTTAPRPEHESARLAALQEYQILDTEPEPAFDELAQLAAHICGTPIALVSFVGAERQWVKACVGVSVTGQAPGVAFCAHTILGDGVFVVPDAERDQRFANSPLVTEWGIRFYAGAPVVSPQSHALGALCVMDREPRSLTAEQQRALRTLAQQVGGQLELRQLARRAEADIAAVLDAAPDGILVVDRSGVIQLANREVGRLFGYQPIELLGQPMEVLIPQWHREELAEHRRAYATAPCTRAMGDGLELTARRKEGMEFPAEVSPTPATGGEELRIVATIRDASHRKQLEAELRDRERRYREIFDAAAVSIWEEDFSAVKTAIEELTASGIGDIRAYFDEHPQFVRQALRAVRIVDVNPQSLTLFGADTKEDLMASLDRIFLPETLEVFREELVAIAEGRRYFASEAPARTLQGERREMLFTISFPPPESPFHRVLVSTLDITERKRMEEALRASEADYRGLVEYATYGIYRSTADGRFITVNPALATMLGYDSADELMSVDVREIYADASDHARLMQEHREHASVEGVEVDWRRKDGSPLTVHLGGRPVRSESGEVECYEMIAEDVTERRRLEAQLRQAQKMEAIGQLTGGIAHDFNNLLTVVSANAEIVASSLPAEVQELRTDLEDVRAAARRGKAMIKKLLSFSRQAILERRAVELQALISDLTSVLRRLLPAHIQIEVCLEDAGGTVEADPGAVEQILLNLATNAQDAMPRGGRLRIEIDTTWLDEGYHATHPWCPPGQEREWTRRRWSVSSSRSLPRSPWTSAPDWGWRWSMV
jgi:PAS domain S-box-containing protein